MAETLAMDSDPEIMNRFLQKLGVPDKWRMVDVLSLEDDALDLVPQPVLALILLFPLSETYEQYRHEQENEILTKGQSAPEDVFHLRQVLSNVCGTIALVHSVANNTHHIDLNDGLLKNYLNDATGLDAAAKGALLENSTAIFEAYRELIQTTGNVDSDEPISNHFVTLIHKDGNLFELDGRKSIPINHGPTTQDDFLRDAAKVCRDFMQREPENIGFNVIALVSTD
ncbi:ubiquitin carboxyl-terminal hydrolase-like [Epargyreus clarus]|uniref:ubiquitin carboxyl-terminal hydrolase-like n=1 Tax=Epargyreus clarus TaxID=520877 RepID=UPI003C2BE814